MEHILSYALNALLDVILPKRCPLCDALINKDEVVCKECYNDLNFTAIKGTEGNQVERLYWARLPIVRANSLLFYHPDTPVARLVLQAKYTHRPKLARSLGKWMAEDLVETEFFRDIDMIIPVPLTLQRQRTRGYNQSERLAQGIHDVTGIAIRNDIVIRTSFHTSQTSLTPEQRKKNVEDAFILQKPEAVIGKHILIVDDVITTNATTMALGQAICGKYADDNPNKTRISILSLALAGQHATPLVTDQQIEEAQLDFLEELW